MKRDFTWVQSIAILFDKHQLFLGALKTLTWDDPIYHLSLTFDGESVTLPEIEDAKCDEVNGVLGQTCKLGYVSRLNIRAKMAVMGGDKDFQTSSLFATDYVVARFSGIN
ncbi:hypothetical protein DITRI_Ditri01bG0067100 [Diplodiscus trichospermus]